MKENIVNILKFLGSSSIGLIILYVVYNSQDATIGEILEGFKGVNVFWLILVAIAFLLSNLSRALRWNMLIKPLGKTVQTKNTLMAIMVGYLVNLGIPRSGEIIKCALVTRYEKVPMDKLIGTIFIDRALDVLCLLLMIGLAFLLQFEVLWGYIQENAFKEDGIEKTSFFMSPIVWAFLGTIALIGIVGFIFREKIQQTTIYTKTKGLVLGVLEGVMSVRKLENPGMFLFHTAFIWFMYYIMTYLAFYAYEPTIGLSAVVALMIFVFGTLGIVVPSPGGLGSYQFFVTAGLVIYGVAREEAFIFSNVLFFTITFCNIFFGFLAFILMPLLNRNSDIPVGE